MISKKSSLNSLQHIENITLNISIDTFVTETNIIYFMYQFILGGDISVCISI